MEEGPSSSTERPGSAGFGLDFSKVESSEEAPLLLASEFLLPPQSKESATSSLAVATSPSAEANRLNLLPGRPATESAVVLQSLAKSFFSGLASHSGDNSRHAPRSSNFGLSPSPLSLPRSAPSDARPANLAEEKSLCLEVDESERKEFDERLGADGDISQEEKDAASSGESRNAGREGRAEAKSERTDAARLEEPARVKAVAFEGQRDVSQESASEEGPSASVEVKSRKTSLPSSQRKDSPSPESSAEDIFQLLESQSFKESPALKTEKDQDKHSSGEELEGRSSSSVLKNRPCEAGDGHRRATVFSPSVGDNQTFKDEKTQILRAPRFDKEVSAASTKHVYSCCPPSKPFLDECEFHQTAQRRPAVTSLIDPALATRPPPEASQTLAIKNSPFPLVASSALQEMSRDERNREVRQVLTLLREQQEKHKRWTAFVDGVVSVHQNAVEVLLQKQKNMASTIALCRDDVAEEKREFVELSRELREYQLLTALSTSPSEALMLRLEQLRREAALDEPCEEEEESAVLKKEEKNAIALTAEDVVDPTASKQSADDAVVRKSTIAVASRSAMSPRPSISKQLPPPSASSASSASSAFSASGGIRASQVRSFESALSERQACLRRSDSAKSALLCKSVAEVEGLEREARDESMRLKAAMAESADMFERRMQRALDEKDAEAAAALRRERLQVEANQQRQLEETLERQASLQRHRQELKVEVQEWRQRMLEREAEFEEERQQLAEARRLLKEEEIAFRDEERRIREELAAEGDRQALQQEELSQKEEFIQEQWRKLMEVAETKASAQSEEPTLVAKLNSQVEDSVSRQTLNPQSPPEPNSLPPPIDRRNSERAPQQRPTALLDKKPSVEPRISSYSNATEEEEEKEEKEEEKDSAASYSSSSPRQSSLEEEKYGASLEFPLESLQSNALHTSANNASEKAQKPKREGRGLVSKEGISASPAKNHAPLHVPLRRRVAAPAPLEGRAECFAQFSGGLPPALSPTTFSPTVLGIPKRVFLQGEDASAEREELVALNGELQRRCVDLQQRIDSLESEVEHLLMEGGGIAGEQLAFVDRNLRELKQYSRILERQNSDIVASADTALQTQRAELERQHAEELEKVKAAMEAKVKEALDAASLARQREEQVRNELLQQAAQERELRDKEKSEMESYVAEEYKKLLAHATAVEEEKRRLEERIVHLENAASEAERRVKEECAAREVAEEMAALKSEAEQEAAEAKKQQLALNRSVTLLERDFAATQRENEGLRLQLLQETENLRRQMERERKELERIQQEKIEQQKALAKQLEEAAAERDARRRQAEGAIYEKALMEARCAEAERTVQQQKREAEQLLKQQQEMHLRNLDEERRHHAKLQRLHTEQLQQLDEKYRTKIAALKEKGTEKAEQKARELQRHYQMLQEEQNQRQQRKEQKEAIEKEIARGKALAELEAVRHECEARCRRAEEEVEKLKAKQQLASIEADSQMEELRRQLESERRVRATEKAFEEALRRKVERSAHEAETLQQQVDDISRKHAAVAACRDRLASELENQQKTSDDLRMRVQQLQKQVAEGEHALRLAQQQTESSVKQHEALQALFDKQREKLEEATAELNKRRQQMINGNERFAALKRNLEEAKKDLEKTAAEADDARRKLAQRDRRIERLEGDILAMEEENQELQQQLRGSAEKDDVVQSLKRELDQTRRQLREERERRRETEGLCKEAEAKASRLGEEAEREAQDAEFGAEVEREMNLQRTALLERQLESVQKSLYEATAALAQREEALTKTKEELQNALRLSEEKTQNLSFMEREMQLQEKEKQMLKDRIQELQLRPAPECSQGGVSVKDSFQETVKPHEESLKAQESLKPHEESLKAQETQEFEVSQKLASSKREAEETRLQNAELNSLLQTQVEQQRVLREVLEELQKASFSKQSENLSKRDGLESSQSPPLSDDGRERRESLQEKKTQLQQRTENFIPLQSAQSRETAAALAEGLSKLQKKVPARLLLQLLLRLSPLLSLTEFTSVLCSLADVLPFEEGKAALRFECQRLHPPENRSTVEVTAADEASLQRAWFSAPRKVHLNLESEERAEAALQRVLQRGDSSSKGGFAEAVASLRNILSDSSLHPLSALRIASRACRYLGATVVEQVVKRAFRCGVPAIEVRTVAALAAETLGQGDGAALSAFCCEVQDEQVDGTDQAVSTKQLVMLLQKALQLLETSVCQSPPLAKWAPPSSSSSSSLPCTFIPAGVVPTTTPLHPHQHFHSPTLCVLPNGAVCKSALHLPSTTHPVLHGVPVAPPIKGEARIQVGNIEKRDVRESHGSFPPKTYNVNARLHYKLSTNS